MSPLLRKIGGYVFAVVFIIAGWWLTAIAVDSPALPTPDAAVAVLAANADQLVPYFLTSAWRVVVSLVIGTVLAVPIAHICARSRTLDTLFAPVLYLLYPIPKVVLLPILLVLFGLADAPKIVLISLTVFFQVLVAVRDAVRAIPDQQECADQNAGKVVPIMERLRNEVDNLEIVVSAEHWPVPSYNDILFYA